MYFRRFWYKHDAECKIFSSLERWLQNQPLPPPLPSSCASIAPLPVKGVNNATTANLTQPNYNQAIAAQLLPRQWPAIVRENGYLKDLKSFL